MKCILCGSEKTENYWEKTERKWGKKVYFSCKQCWLVFLDPDCRISAEAEKQNYLSHENSPENKGYVQFLEQLIIPLSKKIPPGCCGLDFGSGPGPTLNLLMQRRGFEMSHYDPYFHPDTSLLKETYDFVTSTETAEHFCSPQQEFLLLKKLLKKNGALGIMTQVISDEIHFPDWWYHRDPTHISFYTRKTMDWIANWLEFRVEEPCKNVFIFQPSDLTR